MLGAYTLSVFFECKESGIYWVFTNVYAPVNNQEKADFWGELYAIGGFWRAPWLFEGDFNSTRTRAEKQGAGNGHGDRRRFNEFMEEFQLLEFNRDGPNFTFSNKQLPLVLSRLDRFVANVDWVECFKGHTERIMGYNESDHRLLLLMETNKGGGPKPFRFEPHWFEVKGLFEKIKEWWGNFEVNGHAGSVLAKKLKLLKQKLRQWAKEEFGRFVEKISKWEGVINVTDLKEEADSLLEEDLERRLEANILLQQAMNEEENFWSKKAKKRWRLQSDQCLKFFHAIVNSRTNVS